VLRFWRTRQQCEYYWVVKQMLEAMGPRESLLDIGCWDTPVVTWGEFAERYSVDPRERPELPGVHAVLGHWPECRDKLPDSVNVVTCLQTIEHVHDVQTFVDAIFAIATETVVLSVPYRWSTDATPCHHHDPIDEAKLETWSKRKPRQNVFADHHTRLVSRYTLSQRS